MSEAPATFTLRLPEYLNDALDEQAAMYDQSKSGLVREFIHDGIDRMLHDPDIVEKILQKRFGDLRAKAAALRAQLAQYPEFDIAKG
jgi:predicted DNA-binding protein